MYPSARNAKQNMDREAGRCQHARANVSSIERRGELHNRAMIKDMFTPGTESE
jgi:hypothetical protein